MDDRQNIDYSSGSALWIREQFFEDMGKLSEMVYQNKREEKTGRFRARPFISAGIDKDDSDIVWVVPVSTQLEKWEQKIKKVRSKQKNGQCDIGYIGTIRWGTEKQPESRAFATGDMVPIHKKYLQPYSNNFGLQEHTNQMVTAQIRKRSRKLLSMYKGGKRIIGVPVEDLYKAQTGKELEMYTYKQGRSEQIKHEEPIDSKIEELYEKEQAIHQQSTDRIRTPQRKEEQDLSSQ